MYGKFDLLIKTHMKCSYLDRWVIISFMKISSATMNQAKNTYNRIPLLSKTFTLEGAFTYLPTTPRSPQNKSRQPRVDMRHTEIIQ